MRPPDQQITNRDGDVYLNRWWIVRRAKAKRFRFNIYLHHFVRSDEDRALHDHPWWSISFLLKGRAIEHYRNDIGACVIRIPWRFLPVFRKAKHAHRMEVRGDVWTLFITGPKVREWGFHCPGGWVHWKEFVWGRGCDE